MKCSNSDLNSLSLEKYVLGELSSHEMEQINQLVESDPVLLGRVVEIQKSNLQFLEKYPAEKVVPQIQRRYRLKAQTHSAQQDLGSILNRLKAFLRAPTFAVLFLVAIGAPLASHWNAMNWGTEGISGLSGSPRMMSRSGPSEGIRLKGTDQPQLSIYLKSGTTSEDKVQKLNHPARVKKGGLVQISYFVPTRRFGMIFSVDGNHQWTMHFPVKDQKMASSLEPGREVLLPYAFELDDAPGFEKFYLITSEFIFDVQPIFNKLRESQSNFDVNCSLGQLQSFFEKGCHQEVFTLLKN